MYTQPRAISITSTVLLIFHIISNIEPLSSYLYSLLLSASAELPPFVHLCICVIAFIVLPSYQQHLLSSSFNPSSPSSLLFSSLLSSYPSTTYIPPSYRTTNLTHPSILPPSPLTPSISPYPTPSHSFSASRVHISGRISRFHQLPRSGFLFLYLYI